MHSHLHALFLFCDLFATYVRLTISRADKFMSFYTVVNGSKRKNHRFCGAFCWFAYLLENSIIEQINGLRHIATYVRLYMRSIASMSCEISKCVYTLSVTSSP